MELSDVFIRRIKTVKISGGEKKTYVQTSVIFFLFCCLVPLTRPAGEAASAGSLTTTVRFGPNEF